MRKLHYFLNFDFVKWAEGKEFAIQEIKYNEKRQCVSLDDVV